MRVESCQRRCVSRVLQPQHRQNEKAEKRTRTSVVHFPRHNRADQTGFTGTRLTNAKPQAATGRTVHWQRSPTKQFELHVAARRKSNSESHNLQKHDLSGIASGNQSTPPSGLGSTADMNPASQVFDASHQASAALAQPADITVTTCRTFAAQAARPQTSTQGISHCQYCLTSRHCKLQQLPFRPERNSWCNFCHGSAEAAKDSTVPVHNLQSQEVGQYTLPGSIFGIPVRTDILHRVVRWQLAKRQQVLH